MAVYENVQRYSYFMMMLTVAAMLIGATGVFPVTYSVGGYNIMSSIAADVSDTANELTSISTDPSLINIVSGGIELAIKALLIIVKFIAIILVGIGGFVEPIGVSPIVWGPIQVVIDCVVLYDLAKLVFMRGG